MLCILFFTGEAWLHLSGCINKQHSRIWSAENPHALHENPLRSSKIGIWCSVSRIVGQLFFEETGVGVGTFLASAVITHCL